MVNDASRNVLLMSSGFRRVTLCQTKLHHIPVRVIVRTEEVTACLDNDTLRPGPYSHRAILEYKLDLPLSQPVRLLHFQALSVTKSAFFTAATTHIKAYWARYNAVWHVDINVSKDHQPPSSGSLLP